MDTHHRKRHEFLALRWLVRPLCLDVVSALPSQAQSPTVVTLQANLGSPKVCFHWARDSWTVERGHERNTRDFFWRSSFVVQNTSMTFQDSGTCLKIVDQWPPETPVGESWLLIEGDTNMFNEACIWHYGCCWDQTGWHVLTRAARVEDGRWPWELAASLLFLAWCTIWDESETSAVYSDRFWNQPSTHVQMPLVLTGNCGLRRESSRLSQFWWALNVAITTVPAVWCRHQGPLVKQCQSCVLSVGDSEEL